MVSGSRLLAHKKSTIKCKKSEPERPVWFPAVLGYAAPRMTPTTAAGLVRFLVPLAVCMAVDVCGASVAAARTRARAAKGASKTLSTNVSTNLGEKSDAKTDGKVVLFPIKYDDDRTLAVQIERILRTKGFEVVTGLRPVDTAEQYRDVATSMNLVAFVGGDYREVGEKASVTINVRSGYTGKKVDRDDLQGDAAPHAQ